MSEYGNHQFKTVGFEVASTNPKPRNYSGYTTPSEKLENFAMRHLKELFDYGKICEGVLMVGFSAKKGYGTELREKWVDDIVIAQSQKEKLNMYVAKLDEVRRLGTNTFYSVKRMHFVNVYWIKADGEAFLLFENDEWLRAESVEEAFDKIAEFKGYKSMKSPLVLKKIVLPIEKSPEVVINVWQKLYINKQGETIYQTCQIEAGAIFELAEGSFSVKKEYERSSHQEHFDSRFMQFVICKNIICKCGE